MPRLIILLLILAALAVLAVQNFSTAIALVVLSGQTPEIPLGLLLVGAVGIGALVTLILYGLVGAQRPPESKYRPMGSRVPYPDSPGSTTLPRSSPTYEPRSSYSSAFVAEPKTSDSAPDTLPNRPPSRPPDEMSTRQMSTRETSAMPPQGLFSRPQAADYPDGPRANPASRLYEPATRRSGDDWGDARTAEQRNSLDGEDDRDYSRDYARSESQPLGQNSGQKRGLFDFIRAGSAQASPDRLADEIAAGWDERVADDRSGYGADGYGTDGYGTDGYALGDDDLDRGWESDGGALQGNRPIPPGSGAKRVYSDNGGLYGSDPRNGPNLPYPEDDPGTVYEADYRVIVPPSRPLDDEDDY
jgi:hypothetical protein